MLYAGQTVPHIARQIGAQDQADRAVEFVDRAVRLDPEAVFVDA
jgi:hypothetical protein